MQQWNDENAVWRKTKENQKREVTGVTEGLAIWNETTLPEKKSVGKGNPESVLTCTVITSTLRCSGLKFVCVA